MAKIRVDLYWIFLILAMSACLWYIINTDFKWVGMAYLAILIIFALVKIIDTIQGSMQSVETMPLISRKWKRDLGIAFLIGLALIAASVSNNLQSFVPPLAVDNLIGSFITVCLFAPIAEESLFRGALQPTFRIYARNIALVIVIVAVMFASYHWLTYQADVQNYTALLGAAVIGGLFGVMAIIFRSVLPLILIHAMFNFGVLVTTYHIFLAVV